MRESRALWSVAAARELYDQDVSPREIGLVVGVTKSAVHSYAKRHWPAREIDKQRQPKHVKPRTAPKEEAKPVLITGKTTLPPLTSLTFLDET